MAKNYYVITTIIKEHGVTTPLLPYPQMLEMSWADGMVGVMPVFANKKKAWVYARTMPGASVEVFEGVSDD